MEKIHDSFFWWKSKQTSMLSVISLGKSAPKVSEKIILKKSRETSLAIHLNKLENHPPLHEIDPDIGLEKDFFYLSLCLAHYFVHHIWFKFTLPRHILCQVWLNQTFLPFISIPSIYRPSSLQTWLNSAVYFDLLTLNQLKKLEGKDENVKWRVKRTNLSQKNSYAISNESGLKRKRSVPCLMPMLVR